MFELKIISPDEMFFVGEAKFFEFTSTEGERGVYKNHIPTTLILKECVMKIHQADGIKKLKVSGGFVEILQDRITVLAETAEWV